MNELIKLFLVMMITPAGHIVKLLQLSILLAALFSSGCAKAKKIYHCRPIVNHEIAIVPESMSVKPRRDVNLLSSTHKFKSSPYTRKIVFDNDDSARLTLLEKGTTQELIRVFGHNYVAVVSGYIVRYQFFEFEKDNENYVILLSTFDLSDNSVSLFLDVSQCD